MSNKIPQSTLREIPWKKIRLSVFQQRKKPEKIPELAKSLAEVGQLEPIIVQDDGSGEFILWAGCRRYLAYGHNGWENKTMLANVRTYAKEDALGPMADSWIENQQRADVSFVDQARWAHQLVTGTYPVENGGEPVVFNKKDVCARLQITGNYLNKMLATIENVAAEVIGKAIEAKIPARLAIGLSQVQGTGSDEKEQARSRAAKQKELVKDYAQAQERLEESGRKRAARSDKGRKKPANGEKGAKTFLSPNKRLDDRGYTAADYLTVVDAKSGEGKATDKAYYQGMHDMLWWLTGNKKTLGAAGTIKVEDFKILEPAAKE